MAQRYYLIRLFISSDQLLVRRRIKLIICHPLELIFIKTKKVGGTSFEIALSKYCDVDCLITPISKNDEKLRAELGFNRKQNYDFRKLDISPVKKNMGVKGKFKNHMSSEEISNQIPAKIWKSYKKISIHRNPFDAIVSKYFWRQRNQPEELNFEDWLLNAPNMLLENTQISPISGQYKPDIIIRYEKFETDIDLLGIDGFFEIFNKIRAKGQFRKNQNTSVSHMFKNNSKLINLVSDICAEEIKYFNYQRPNP